MLNRRKKKSTEEYEEARRIKEKDWNFYMHIWRKRKHISEVSGEWLGSEPLTTMFHHILKKKDYPEFRYLEENIILLTWIEHTNAEDNPEKYPEVLKRYNKLLELWEKTAEERSKNGTESLEEELKAS